MRVLLTVPSLAREFGGPAAKALQLSAALEELGHPVEVIGCGRANGAIGLPILGRLHATPIPRKLSPVVRAVRRADVVHVLGYRDPVGTVAALVARRTGTPYVLEPVGMHSAKLRSFRLKALYESVFGKVVAGFAEGIIATSSDEESELISSGVDESRVFKRPNGVSLDGIYPLPSRGRFRSRIDVPLSAPLVMVISRLAMSKGLPGFVEAVGRLTEVWAVIAGPDDRDGTLSRLSTLRCALGLEDRLVIIPGGLWGQEKAEALADADCFCLPSATESFGIAAAESAAVGLPVVVSDRCGVREWLDPISSRVFRYGNTQELALSLSDLLNSHAGEAAHRAASHLRDALNWHSVAKKQVHIYEQILQNDASTKLR